MKFLNEQVILELGNEFTEWKKELVLTHHVFGNLPHFWLVLKTTFEKTRCPFICDCVIYHKISGDIRQFDVYINYNNYPTFYDFIFLPIIQQYCFENFIELNVTREKYNE